MGSFHKALVKPVGAVWNASWPPVKTFSISRASEGGTAKTAHPDSVLGTDRGHIPKRDLKHKGKTTQTNGDH